ncbi:hypothetical protein ACIQM0_17010 [Streptomyces sp. NPDC091387]
MPAAAAAVTVSAGQRSGSGSPVSRWASTTAERSTPVAADTP